MNRQEYIDHYKSLIEASTANTGLFPSVMMAQAILESGNGNSLLASGYNNHFGIKAGGSWPGQKVNMQTREVVSGQSQTEGAYFRVYNTPADSFRDRNLFLIGNANYSKARVFHARTPEEQAVALQRAGYASDPNYASVLISLINAYKLKSLDEDFKKKESAHFSIPLGWGLRRQDIFSSAI